jgi:hypothetical protein
MTKAAIARVLSVSPSTITGWLAKAGDHAAAFHKQNARLPEAVEVQLDELSCKGAGEARNAWAYSGVEVWSRFWATLKVGRRTLGNTYIFARQLRTALIGESKDFLVTSKSRYTRTRKRCCSRPTRRTSLTVTGATKRHASVAVMAVRGSRAKSKQLRRGTSTWGMPKGCRS